jgi:predicted transcriptional regulator
MEAMRESWTDERLDDFAVHSDRRFDTLERRMDSGFNRVEERFQRVDERFDKIDERFERMEERFDRLGERIVERFEAMQRTMLHGVLVLSGAFMAGFAALVGLVATQL